MAQIGKNRVKDTVTQIKILYLRDGNFSDRFNIYKTLRPDLLPW